MKHKVVERDINDKLHELSLTMRFKASESSGHWTIRQLRDQTEGQPVDLVEGGKMRLAATTIFMEKH